MAELPKIVRDQLAREAHSETGPAPFGSGFHPDANLLSAFVEQSLAPGERERVIRHLAECVACRELVAVAFPPELEPEGGADASAGASARPRWSALPLGKRALRWGVLAASVAIVLVGAFRSGILRWPSSETAPKTTVAQIERSASPAPTQTLPNPASAPASSTDSKQLATSEARPALDARQTRAEPRARLKQEEVSAAAAGRELAVIDQEKTKDHSRLAAPAANQVAQDAFVRRDNEVFARIAAPPPAAPAPASAPPPANPARGAIGAGSALPPQQQQAQQQQQLQQIATAETVEVQGQPAAAANKKAAPPPEPVLNQPGEEVANARAQTGAVAAVVGGSFDARGHPVQGLLKAKPELRAYWTISGSGKLERSQAPGGPWQAVRVDSSITFQSVAADGASVWAGGSAGALYHSTDGGDHWTRVTLGPDQNGRKALATGSIVSIKFSDAQHGVIATDTGETWTTADGGAHWSLDSPAH